MTKAEIILGRILNLKNSLGFKGIKMLDLDIFERIVLRLDSFKDECSVCNQFLDHLDNYFLSLEEKKDSISKEDLKRHKDIKTELIIHLTKQHKLIQKGQNLAIYMSLGMGVGAVLGLTVLENPAIGIPLGMAIGIGVGTLLDHSAKRIGKVI